MATCHYYGTEWSSSIDSLSMGSELESNVLASV